MEESSPGRGGITIQPVVTEDHPWMRAVLSEHWGSARVVSRGRLHDALACPAFVARDPNERIGFATYRVEGDQCEILTMNSLRPRRGIGRRLVEAVTAVAEEHGCRRIWLVTTNDNSGGQKFWERVGFALAQVHEGAMIEARRIKPEIPLRGEGGVPITDEWEYERFLGDGETEGGRS